MKKLLSILFICISVTIFAEGAGGIFAGSWTGSSLFSNSSANIEFSGGFGYGVDSKGFKTGGFGMYLSDPSRKYSDFVGAFGGLISGVQYDFSPLYAGIDVWAGVGYLGNDFDRIGGVSFMGLISAEAGVQVFPWMGLSLVGGMQLLVPFDQLRHFDEGMSSLYSPFVAVKLAWGSFKAGE